MMTKPNLSFWKLWNLSFGFFGVQIAYALQSANISRIFGATHCRNLERQDMVPFRPTNSLSLCGSYAGCLGDVSFA